MIITAPFNRNEVRTINLITISGDLLYKKSDNMSVKHILWQDKYTQNSLQGFKDSSQYLLRYCIRN